MLTQLEIRFVDFIYSHCCYSFTLPLAWKDGQLSQKVNRRTRWNFAISLVMVSILAYKLVQVKYLILNKDINGSILHDVVLIGTFANAVVKLNVWLYQTELIRLVNNIFTCNSRWGKQLLKKDFITCPRREKVFIFTVLSLASAIVLASLVLIITRNESFSTYQLLVNDYHWTSSWLAFLLFASIEIFLAFDQMVGAMFIIPAIYISWISINFWVQYICTEWSNQERESDACSIQACISRYRGIFMMNRDCNKALGRIVVPWLKLELMLCFIISLFAVVRLHNYLDLVPQAFVAVCVCASILLLVPISIVMSNLYKMSKQFSTNITPKISRVRGNIDKRILQMQLESCPLIRCQIGSFYYMEAKAKLTMLNEVVSGLVFVMVNWKV